MDSCTTVWDEYFVSYDVVAYADFLSWLPLMLTCILNCITSNMKRNQDIFLSRRKDWIVVMDVSMILMLESGYIYSL